MNLLRVYNHFINIHITLYVFGMMKQAHIQTYLVHGTYPLCYIVLLEKENHDCLTSITLYALMRCLN